MTSGLVVAAQPEGKAPSRQAIALQSWEEFNRDAPFVFLEETNDLVLKTDWTVEEMMHYRIKIQKDSAKDLGEQKIYYNRDRESILDIQAFVETPDGEQYPFTKVQDLAVDQESLMYSDARVKIVTLPQVNKGSVIDVTVKSRMFKPQIPGQFSEMEYYPDIPHKHYKSTYTFPKDKGIQFKQYKTLISPRVEEQGDNVVYTFEYTNTAPLKESEEYLPPYTDMFGISSFSSMADWDVLSRWYDGLVQKNIVDDPAIRAKTEELVAGKKTAKEKGQAILEFLQDNFRYVSMSFGDHTVEPHPTNEIFANRYGDCKDWSILAKQMLNLAGIPADIVLFNDEFAGNPQWSLPSVTAFDHVILRVTLDDKSYFVDPQLKHYDFGQFPQLYNNAHLLVIKADGHEFTNIPPVPEDDVKNIIKVEALLGVKGSASYHVKAKMNVEVSNYLRQIWDSLPQDGKERFFADIEAGFAKGGQLTNQDIEGIDKRYGPLLLKFNITNPHAYQVVNNLMILREPFDQYFPNPFVGRQRTYPLFNPENSLFKILAIYKIPSGFQLDYAPPDYDLENDLVRLSRKINVKDGKIYASYVYTLKRGSLSVDRYPELLKVWEDYYQENSKDMMLKHK